MDRFSVLICGGGFAALEGVLRLHRLAGDRITLTLLAPHEELIYRPLTVLTPFTQDRPRRHPIRPIVADTGAHWIRDSADWVDLPTQTVHTAGGQSLHFDALLLAVGAQERAPNPHVSLFTDRTSGQTYRHIIDDVNAGTVARLVLIESVGPAWPLPLYELALLTAKHAHERTLPLAITLITPNPHPLHAFGDDVGIRVEGLLREAGIALHTRSRARVDGASHLQLAPDDVALHPDRIVSLPTITGPNIRGIPGGAVDRFIPIDDRCRVRGVQGAVFAAGDATDLPIKHGSLAAQQADAAAAAIAHLAGAGPKPEALRPVIRGTLLTGDKPLYLLAHLVAGTSWRAQILDEPPWPPDQLVVADELARYLTKT